MKKKFLFFVFFVFNMIDTIAQVQIPLNPLNFEKEMVNKLNSEGKKEGLWIDTVPGKTIHIGMYKNGEKHGFFQVYMSNIYGEYDLTHILNYKDGLLESPCFRYSAGILVYYIDTIVTIGKEGNRLKRKEHCYGYENGMLESEGWYLFFDDDNEMDVDLIGTWIFYENGTSYEKYYGPIP